LPAVSLNCYINFKDAFFVCQHSLINGSSILMYGQKISRGSY